MGAPGAIISGAFKVWPSPARLGKTLVEVRRRLGVPISNQT